MNRPDAYMAPPRQNLNRDLPPPPCGSYYGPDTGPPQHATQRGYNQNRNYARNNRRNNNKFRGRSGPRTWVNPGKRNWENSWDDMINTPGRMGEMPGGWTAPEVTVPNPVDMGDQVKDLPEQIKDMDVDN